MRWYQRLRWRLIGSQFLVATVGVLVMMLATRVIILQSAPRIIHPLLVELAIGAAPQGQVENALIIAFRDAVLLSVAVAAFAALVAGVASSILLWRTIITPLRRMASSSQRVASGHYGERVHTPHHGGEAMQQLVISFNQMAQSLQEVENQRVTLLGNVSHELRTPLTGLKGYLEGLMDGLFPADEETFSWMSQEIDRLQRLVDDLQHLSKVESGQLSLQMSELSLNDLVARTVAQLLPQAQAKGIELINQPSVGQWRVHGDPDRVAQIMLNLIGNAIRYTDAGGTVGVSIRNERRQLLVDVTDNGIGIPPESLPYLFERFYRVDSSRSRQRGGSGIGLTIARHLAWAMGGDITVTSPGPGLGSSFTLVLPLA